MVLRVVFYKHSLLCIRVSYFRFNYCQIWATEKIGRIIMTHFLVEDKFCFSSNCAGPPFNAVSVTPPWVDHTPSSTSQEERVSFLRWWWGSPLVLERKSWWLIETVGNRSRCVLWKFWRALRNNETRKKKSCSFQNIHIIPKLNNIITHFLWSAYFFLLSL